MQNGGIERSNGLSEAISLRCSFPIKKKTVKEKINFPAKKNVIKKPIKPSPKLKKEEKFFITSQKKKKNIKKKSGPSIYLKEY